MAQYAPQVMVCAEFESHVLKTILFIMCHIWDMCTNKMIYIIIPNK